MRLGEPIINGVKSEKGERERERGRERQREREVSRTRVGPPT